MSDAFAPPNVAPEGRYSSDRGYLTLAARHRMYLEMAVDLALSLRDWNLEPVSLVVDARLREAAERHYHSVFDEILSLPEEYDFGRALKYSVGELTPYLRTLFIDADTLSLGPLEETWRRLAGRRFAMMGETLLPDHEGLHHGRPAHYWCRRFGLQRYFKTHSAVFFFEKEEGQRVLAECLAAYRDRAYSRLRWTGDEVGFAIVADRSSIDTFPGPSPILWNEQLASIDLSAPEAPLLHMLGNPPRSTVDRLVASVADRRRRAGIPGDSESYWRLKAASSNTGVIRGRLFPLGRRLLDLRWKLRREV